MKNLTLKKNSFVYKYIYIYMIYAHFDTDVWPVSQTVAYRKQLQVKVIKDVM